LLNHIFSLLYGYGGEGYYPKQQYRAFQELERSHRPYAVGFVPEYGADDGAKANNEEVFAAETLQEEREVSHVEDGAEDGVEEVSGEKEFPKLHVMAKHSNLHLTDKNVMSAYILLLDQAEFAELFKVMVGNAGAAEVQCVLDFADAGGFTVLEEVPVDPPSLAT
jgi:hypothetical protein